MTSPTPPKDWIGQYALSHTHPVNRTLHTWGIPMIALSVVLFLLSFLFGKLVWVATGLFVVGWVLQFVGHYYEKKPPEFLKDPRFLFVGLRWWFAKMQGKA